MKLGNILKMSGGTPETGRPVRFQLRKKQKDGSFCRVWADAQLLPVTMSEIAEVNADVADYMAEHPGANKDDEINIRFLAKALHDAQRNALKFIDGDQIEEFAKAVVPEQVGRLIVEYKIMIRSEYQECWASDQERKEAEEKAEDFSGDGTDESLES